MSAFTPASEVLLRHSDDFEQSRILFAGDLQDDLPARFECAASRAHTQQFHHWQALSRQMGENVRFSLVAQASDVADCDTLIYYWPKNKPEAQFQLMNILSLMPVGVDVFVVGENRSGVRSAEPMLADYAPLNKVDSARRCGLYHGRLERQPQFSLESWWAEYNIDGLTIKTLPGVFSRDGLDVGSQLLLSTLTPHTKGKVLDVGCGAGVLSAALASH
ncbi:16S rRNA (guanine(1207)-N(2))-methyltransferase RsmC, partial [Salmonella enterica]|nr:16S rRNA (guanine(1207)-N(2))-methyltransferase RsmC [Salmonella enterica]